MARETLDEDHRSREPREPIESGTPDSTGAPPGKAEQEEVDPPRFLLRGLNWLLAAGLVGMASELLLTEHYEDRDQAIPLAALAFSALSLGWFVRTRSLWARRISSASWFALALAGLAGIVLHYRSNYEFQEELHPDLGLLGLFLASLRATSPPSLAPGSLTLLAALGFLSLLATPKNVR